MSDALLNGLNEMALRAIDLWYGAKFAYTHYWTATGTAAGAGAVRYALTGNPATLQWAGRMASFGVRAHGNAVLGVLRTPLVTGSTTTIGSAGAQLAKSVAVGYVIGAGAGTLASWALFGEKGRDAAHDLYMPGGASFLDDALFEMDTNIKSIYSHYMD